MNKSKFLALGGAVDHFCIWLMERLPTLDVRLKFASSRFVPGGLDVTVRGIEKVLLNYRWTASWTDAQGNTTVSHDWESTRRSLHELGNWLRASVAAGHEATAAEVAFAILKWGGVRSARRFVEKKRDHGAFCAYVAGLAPFLSLDGDADLDELTSRNIELFDSGMTKIHSIYDTSGSPIYDSRVGAAMAMLWALFGRETGTQAKALRDELRFPSGPARGNQIRDPGGLGIGLPSAPQFYTVRVSPEAWARWQVMTGWIIQSVLQRDAGLFASLKSLDGRVDLAARCHAFEASLFMIGYDLRCLLKEKDLESVAVSSTTVVERGGARRSWKERSVTACRPAIRSDWSSLNTWSFGNPGRQ